MKVIKQQWLLDTTVHKLYLLTAALLFFGGCSNAFLISNTQQNLWLEQTLFSRFLIFSLLIPSQILLLLSTFRIRFQDIYIAGGIWIIWKQLKYRLIEILLSSLLPWACGSLTGMFVNGWRPTLGTVATEALIRCLYLILSCLALLLLTSFCFLISNRITAFLVGFVINGLSFFLNVNHHLSILYDFVVPEFATLLFSCLPIMLGLLLFLFFIVQREISRKDL